jgi:hypothetical protein
MEDRTEVTIATVAARRLLVGGGGGGSLPPGSAKTGAAEMARTVVRTATRRDFFIGQDFLLASVDAARDYLESGIAIFTKISRLGQPKMTRK